MQAHELKSNPHNPRSISPAKLAMLKRAMGEFGDLSGIIFNRKSKQLVGGHQRKLHLGADATVTVLKQYPKSTRTGTVAEGFVEFKGERFAYREVEWSPEKEKAAAIAANKGAGEWDKDKLAVWFKELSTIDFDFDFDLDLTMFTAKEIHDLPSVIDVSGHTRKTKSGKDDKDEEDAPPKENKPPKCKHGQVYILGGTRLRCSREELYFCDQVIAKYERDFARSAILEETAPKAKTSKAVEQVKRRKKSRG